MFIMVDLPAPFSPSRACTSPALTRRLASLSACVPPKLLVMPDIDSNASGESVSGACGTDSRCGIDTSRSEEHTSELQSRGHLVCRLLLEKKKTINKEDKERASE